MDDERPLLVGLVRVSTEKQEESGLGLDAQLAAIEVHRARIHGELLEVYREVEAREDVQYLLGHAEPRTTALYDRRKKQVTRNIVERIPI
jgi:hypothetical protein